MNPSETVRIDNRQLDDLQKLVWQGEGMHLEFKRKVAFPDKVIREMIAFANTEGGTLLIGVDDDGTISGVKYPDEEMLLLRQSLHEHCRPAIHFDEVVIPISKKKFVIRYDVQLSGRRPHFFVGEKESKACFVRFRDMSVKASREVHEIVRRSKKEKDIRFTFGEAEKKLMEYLDEKENITLPEFRRLAGLNRFMAAKKLILLVLANVLRVSPTEKGDLYSRI
jgi:predicted HTH transcriptional regulator